MRPRLLHLGYGAELMGGFDVILEASMRPRLLHLGYRRHHHHRRRSLRRFNEAEAFTPRILGDVMTSSGAALKASMRPRLLHLGYDDRIRRPCASLLLLQ